MRKFDITDKLELSGNPCLVIAGQELEVNADAATVLRIMDKFGQEKGKEMSPKDLIEVYRMVFPEESQEKISYLKLQFHDLATVIMEAVNLIVGSEDGDKKKREPRIHTTT